MNRRVHVFERNEPPNSGKLFHEDETWRYYWVRELKPYFQSNGGAYTPIEIVHRKYPVSSTQVGHHRYFEMSDVVWAKVCAKLLENNNE